MEIKIEKACFDISITFCDKQIGCPSIQAKYIYSGSFLNSRYDFGQTTPNRWKVSKEMQPDVATLHNVIYLY